MSELISKELEKSLQRAYNEAKRRRHEFVTLEHLLYALTFDQTTCDVLLHTGVDVTELGKDLKNFIDNKLSSLTIPEKKEKKEHEPKYTMGFQYIMQVAITHGQSSQEDKKINGANILASLFREEESFAVYFLKKQGLTRLAVVRYISHGMPSYENDAESVLLEKEETRKETKLHRNPLQFFCTNLTELAKAKKIDPLIGRKKELDRMIHILARRRKNNPILVGDAGVGKTAIVEGLASQIAYGESPSSLEGYNIFSLDMAGLLAGTRYRGEFEERLKAIMDNIKKQKKTILFIDEIHTIIGAGAVSGGAIDTSNILKPALANGEISCIGTTTYKDYRSIFEKDHALSRRFQKVEISEPPKENTIKILEGIQNHYEKYHGVLYSSGAIRHAVELSSLYIRDRKLPDKAIDIIDEVGAKIKLRTQKNVLKQQKNRSNVDTNSTLSEAINDKSFPNRITKITAKDIEALISDIANVPARAIKTSDKEELKDLGANLKKMIFGQNEAIESVVSSIQLSQAGLGEENKPIGSFLFAGPTGVGKTELSKQLANELGSKLIRFDMSEYIEKHTVSRLIGSPPGYIGFEQGGLLTEAVHKDGHCILLLDELEKAHEDIFNILLQVMDYATLTDNNGRISDFRNVILIMTTNVGGRESLNGAIGFESNVHVNRSLKAVEKAFSPEFRNRLSAIIQFNGLTEEQIRSIVKRMINELSMKLQKKQITIELEESAERYLAKEGFDAKYGARPIQRLIEKEISHPLSSEILFGNLKRGGKVTIKTNRGKKLEFIYSHC